MTLLHHVRRAIGELLVGEDVRPNVAIERCQAPLKICRDRAVFDERDNGTQTDPLRLFYSHSGNRRRTICP